MSIPGDLSVISFDDEPLASYLRPQVTTLRLLYKEMGEVATTMVLQHTPTSDTARYDGLREEADHVDA